jgi:hypothetical protein
MLANLLLVSNLEEFSFYSEEVSLSLAQLVRGSDLATRSESSSWGAYFVSNGKKNTWFLVGWTFVPVSLFLYLLNYVESGLEILYLYVSMSSTRVEIVKKN